MNEIRIQRHEIIDRIATDLEDTDFVRAAWLGGSDASGRTDSLSDIDIQFIVEDERVEDGFELLHTSLEKLGPITHRFRFPEPVWHGHSQEILSIAGADPCHFIDVLVLKKSADDRFLEKERHGEALVLFDREGLLVPPPLDWEAHHRKMHKRLETLREQFFLFQPIVDKAARRRHQLDAVNSYVAATLRPLVEILRMRHCPERFDYGPRYLDRDLPDRWQKELERLSFPASVERLAEFRQEAEAHFREQLEAYDRGEWEIPRPGGAD